VAPPYEKPAAKPPWIATDLRRLVESPWLLPAAAILLALALNWLGSLIFAFEHPAVSIDARDRILRALAPGSIEWAVVLLLCAALLRIASAGADDDAGRVWRRRLLSGTFVASCAVGGAAAIDFIVYLTLVGRGPDSALSSALLQLAAVPVAGAAAWWAFVSGPDEAARVLSRRGS
jgi:hypothetical protein